MKTLRDTDDPALHRASLTDDLHALESDASHLHALAHRAAMLVMAASTDLSHQTIRPSDLRRAAEAYGQRLDTVKANGRAVLPRLDGISGARLGSALSPAVTETFECFLLHLHAAASLIASGDPGLSLCRAELFRFVNKDLDAAISGLSAAVRASLEETRNKDRTLAFVDDLTDLPNRRAFYDHCARIWASGQNQIPIVLMRLDLDRFKKINDDYGHAAGDVALMRAAGIIRQNLRSEDFVSRVGGDEFVVMISSQISDQGLASRADRIIARIAEPFDFEGHKLRLGISIGSVRANVGSRITIDRMLHNADLALYAAKAGGGGRHHQFTAELRSRHERNETLAREIERGLGRGEFVPHFQPQVDARTGTLTGLEALARWHHPERGTLTPYHFLTAAQDAGLLNELDDQITTASLRAMKTWHSKALAVPQLSINISAQRLVRSDLGKDLTARVQAAGLPNEVVALEILESAMIESSSVQMIETVRNLSAAGFRLELDDFGTGHASIANLRHFKVDRIKIDRSFIKDVHVHPELAKITSAMISLAHSLRIDALAEGVETAEERLVLNALGIDQIQGFGVARPMPENEIVAWIHRTQHRFALPPRKVEPLAG